MLLATVITFFLTCMHLRFFMCNCCKFWILNCKISSVSFAVIIRIVVVDGFVLVNGIIIIKKLFQCKLDCYFHYYCLFTALNYVWFRWTWGCPGSLISLYWPTFRATPLDLCITLQCKIYIDIYIIMHHVLWK